MKEIIVKANTDFAERIFNAFNKIVKDNGNFAAEPLYKCKARVVWGYGVLILYSYSAPIAVVDIRKEVCYECLRLVYGYTSTSNQHIAKFKKYLREKSPSMFDSLTFYSVR